MRKSEVASHQKENTVRCRCEFFQPLWGRKNRKQARTQDRTRANELLHGATKELLSCQNEGDFLHRWISVYMSWELGCSWSAILNPSMTKSPEW